MRAIVGADRGPLRPRTSLVALVALIVILFARASTAVNLRDFLVSYVDENQVRFTHSAEEGQYPLPPFSMPRMRPSDPAQESPPNDAPAPSGDLMARYEEDDAPSAAVDAPSFTTAAVPTPTPAPPEAAAAGPDGGYKAIMTVHDVCAQDQFATICDLMGLRDAYGDVRQDVLLDFDAARREVYIKAAGHKPLFKIDWCGPLTYALPDDPSAGGEIRLTGEEPACMAKLRKKLKKDTYYYDPAQDSLLVKADIKPHSVVGWVDGELSFDKCPPGSAECTSGA